MKFLKRPPPFVLLDKNMIVCGMMSGTSLDGIDVAVMETDGHSVQCIMEHAYLPYPAFFQHRLKHILGRRHLDNDILEVTRQLMDYHSQAFFSLECHKSVECVGVHGQTIFHQPKMDTHPAQTWQIVDAEYLRFLIQKTIVYDFRSEDIAQGGEGAPLVPVYHHALFKNHTKPLGVLNIGGVANITILMGEGIEDMYAGDIGPGNALMNDFLHERTGLFFDDGGKIAASGKIHENILSVWWEHPYFDKNFPKSLDRDTFSDVLKDMDTLSTQDGMRTLLEFTVQSIVRSIQEKVAVIYTCGGGVNNTFLMERLREEGNACLDPFSVHTTESMGQSSDFMEAEAFAFLSGRVIKGLPTSLPRTTGVKHPTCGGRMLS